MSMAKTSCNSRRHVLQSSLASAVSLASGPAVAAYIDPDQPKVTKRCYLDVQIGDKESDRLVIGLFGEALPRTVENFERLCSNNSYAGTTFYRVLADYNIQGGAIGDPSGKTGQSAFGAPFEPDNYDIKHSKAGLVSAVRGVGGAVDSRFFINSEDDAGWADDRYAAFGIVQEGMDFIKKIEKVKVKSPANKPVEDVTIVKSGIVT